MRAEEISHERLLNLGIAQATAETPDDVVGRLVAVQAQDFAGAKWALGLRLRNARDEDIEQAFNEGSILRTHMLRPTWHFVTPADIRWLLRLSAPRVHAANATQYRKLGLDQEPFNRSNDVIAKALQDGNQLTRDELRDALRQDGIIAEGGQSMGYIMMRAELDGIVCSGPRRGKQFTYMLLDERAPLVKPMEREEALAQLVLHYFVSRGPATVQDFVKWSGMTTADTAIGLEAAQSHLRQETIDGKTYWMPIGAIDAKGDVSPKAYLLSVYDEYISSYKDRSAINNPATSAKLISLGNALNYVVVVNGQIVGTWRRTLRKDSVIIETNTFTALTKAEEEAVVEAAKRYGDFWGLRTVLE